MNGYWGLVGAAVTVLGVITGGWFTYKGTRVAAALAAAPAAKAQDFAVIEKTLARVDKENDDIRKRQSRLEAVVRGFAWTLDRWSRQMIREGIEPEPPHPLVDEYNRTGV
ncbi:hypothetical protein [Streptomyces sp. NPDC048272]|uniref:hypothetical protein n=1 Tax=Streptomyces sp. NPDC048272 TaxID=3154616 RepID=UPI003423E87E